MTVRSDLIDALAWLEIAVVNGPLTEGERIVAGGFLGTMRVRYGESKVACTCHPDDNPPRPCPQKFALTECRQAASALETSPEQDDDSHLNYGGGSDGQGPYR